MAASMPASFLASVVHLDAVPPVCSIALVHPAEVCNLEAPIAIRNGAADDGGVGIGGCYHDRHDPS